MMTKKKVPAKTESTKPKLKMFIATPMYGGQCTGFYAQSLLGLQNACGANGVEAMLSFMFNESLITRARNSLVNGFLKTDCTHLLFIDADLRFDGVDVVRMLLCDKDVICGIYPKKEINWYTVEMAVKRGVPQNLLKHHTASWVLNLKNYDASVTVNVNEPFEVFAGGTGMMLIKREVFEKLMPVTPFYNSDMVDLAGTQPIGEKIHDFFALSIEPETNRLLSEDYHFCRQWRLQGGTIWAAPWMKLGHVGSYIFEGELAVNEEGEASNADQ